MSLIRNERIKLTATFLNGMGLALFAVGAVSPVIASVYGGRAADLRLMFVGGVCLFSAIALHFIARGVLKGLQP